MPNVFLRRLLATSVLAPLVACGSDEPQTSSAPTAVPAVSPTVVAVVQPQPLTVTRLGPGGQTIGDAQAVTIQPIVAGERLDLRPVTR